MNISILKQLDTISKRFNERKYSEYVKETSGKEINSEMVKSKLIRDMLHAFNGGDLLNVLDGLKPGYQFVIDKKMPVEGDYLWVTKQGKTEYIVSCVLGACKKTNEIMDTHILADFLQRMYRKYYNNGKGYMDSVRQLSINIR